MSNESESEYNKTACRLYVILCAMYIQHSILAGAKPTPKGGRPYREDRVARLYPYPYVPRGRRVDLLTASGGHRRGQSRHVLLLLQF